MRALGVWVTGALLLSVAGCSSSSSTAVNSQGAGPVGTGGAGGAGGGSSGTGGGGGSNPFAARASKVDLLFAIDNSSSMLDKQQILANAIGDLLAGLVNPACVDSAGHVTDQPASPSAPCATAGAARAFHPIADIHVGVVSSSLGSAGADVCIFDPDLPPGPSNNPTKDDHGHLLARGHHADNDYTYSATVATYTPPGKSVADNFLAWDPGAGAMPPMPANPGKGADTDATNLISRFQEIIYGVDQAGCGFEHQMEGWYRFLIDPHPPLMVTQTSSTTPPTVSGVDTVLLQQRADFLRPDSLVAVVLISDENEHSVIVGSLPSKVCEQPTFDANGAVTDCAVALTDWPASYHVAENFDSSGAPMAYNYAALQIHLDVQSEFPVFAGSDACKTDPLSPECHECLTSMGTGPGCSPADPLLEQDSDLRQWDMKRRFGWDAEYPAQRYVDGLHAPKVYDSNGNAVPNPLFDDLPYNADKAAEKAGGPKVTRMKAPPRDPGLVFLTAIVGVPWQDVARTGPDGAPDLSLGYKSPHDPDPAQKIDWALILGDPHNPDPSKRDPGDPLMIEAQDRTAALAKTPNHPITKEPLGATQWNSINGHEWNAADGHDLQYTCFVAQPSPHDCNLAFGSCDCTDFSGMQDPMDLQALNNPLCEPLTDPSNPVSPGAGQAAITGPGAFKQYRAHAYSGRRFLEVLKGLSDAGGNAIVASICARNVAFGDPVHANDADLGYRPALAALMAQAEGRLMK